MICRRHRPLSRGWLGAASLTGWLNLVFIRIFMFIALSKSVFFFFFFLFWCLNLWTGPGIARISPPTLASSYFGSVNFSDRVVGRGFYYEAGYILWKTSFSCFVGWTRLLPASTSPRKLVLFFSRGFFFLKRKHNPLIFNLSTLNATNHSPSLRCKKSWL